MALRTASGERWRLATLLSISSNPPKRGEIWLVDFEPDTVAQRFRKLRLALVVNSTR